MFLRPKCPEGLTQSIMSGWLSKGLIKMYASCTFVSSLLCTKHLPLLLPSSQGNGCP